MIEMTANRYGKSRVRLMKVTRNEGYHELYEWMVEVLLEGDYETAHTLGDNSKILPTDTMKNTVYFLARESKATSIEVFAQEMGAFLMGRNPQVSAVHVKIEAVMWKRLTIDGSPHPDSFMRGSNERQITWLRQDRSGTTLRSGLEDLVIMKTAKSGFEDYIVDELTTLKPTADRLFCTALTADWVYSGAIAGGGGVDFNALREEIRETMLESFAGHDSLSVQHTLYAMGETALNKVKAITEVHLLMPNKHCIPVDLSRFGQENPNEIFVPTDEPHGTIEATLRRK
jgi:urate oxidase